MQDAKANRDFVVTEHAWKQGISRLERAADVAGTVVFVGPFLIEDLRTYQGRTFALRGLLIDPTDSYWLRTESPTCLFRVDEWVPCVIAPDGSIVSYDECVQLHERVRIATPEPGERPTIWRRHHVNVALHEALEALIRWRPTVQARYRRLAASLKSGVHIGVARDALRESVSAHASILRRMASLFRDETMLLLDDAALARLVECNFLSIETFLNAVEQSVKDRIVDGLASA